MLSCPDARPCMVRVPQGGQLGRGGGAVYGIADVMASAAALRCEHNNRKAQFLKMRAWLFAGDFAAAHVGHPYETGTAWHCRALLTEHQPAT